MSILDLLAISLFSTPSPVSEYY